MAKYNRQFFVGKKSYDLDVMLQQTGAYTLIRKFGKIDTTLLNTKMDIWNFVTPLSEYNFIDIAGGVPLFIVSDDNTANQLCSIKTLNSEGVEVTEYKALTGHTPVPLTLDATYTRHQSSSIFALKANPIAGNFYVYSGTATLGIPDDPTKVYGYITQGENRSQQALYTIPTDCYGFFIDVHAYFVKKQTATTILILESSLPFGNNTPLDLTDFPSKQTDKRLVSTVTMTTVKPDARREFELSEPLPPGTDLIYSQNADVAAAGVALEFDIICIKKEFFGTV